MAQSVAEFLAAGGKIEVLEAQERPNWAKIRIGANRSAPGCKSTAPRASYRKRKAAKAEIAAIELFA